MREAAEWRAAGMRTSAARKGPARGADLRYDLSIEFEEAVFGCEKEIETFCADVTPGEGRLLACFYAHGDKLSGSCDYALYDAAAQLERFISALTYVANECDADLDQFCGEVAVGEGRVARCLLDNKARLSERCSRAIDDTGLNANGS